jgi:hypothetical protein
MSSAASPIRTVLEGYVAGRVKAERVVEAVAAAYYMERGAGSRERLRPLMDVIERAHPGTIELTGTAEKPGFAVRLAERPFPKEYEGALKEAVRVALEKGQFSAPSSSSFRAPLPAPGLFARLYTAVRRFFTAST